MKTNTIELLDSIRIAYWEVGEGPVILFVHGLGSNKKAWKKTIEGLKDDYRCIALDLPGYGESETGDYPQTMQFFSECIFDFARKVRIEKFHLAGHSMGGQVALYSAIHHPELLMTLILMAPAGIETFSEKDRMFLSNAFDAQLIQSFDEARIRMNFNVNFFKMPDDAQFMVEDRLALRKDSTAYAEYAAMIPRCVQGMLQDAVFQDLKMIETPTVIFYGNQDALIPNKYLHPQLTTQLVAQKAKAQLSNAKIHLIDEAGHFVHWEQSDKVNPLVKAFLE